MTEPGFNDGGEISLFALGTSLVRNRWRIIRWSLIVGVLAALSVISRPPLYSASLSFVPQGGADGARSGLASLAGQFGLLAPSSNLSQSPEFYVGLLKSRELLEPIVRDTITVREMSDRRIQFYDLFEIANGSPRFRQEAAVKVLSSMVGASVAKNTGVVQASVVTRWPSVSLAIANRLLEGVNDYNIRIRQSQAAAERRFVEGRLAIARLELRAAEDRLQSFLSGNRETGAPQLAFERDRIQRDVSLRQQVYTTLTQAYEDVRIREVRDTPALTIFESPEVSSLPEPRGRAKRVLLGLIVGALIGTALALVSEMMARKREVGDPEADAFIGALREVKSEVFGRLRWPKTGTPS